MEALLYGSVKICAPSGKLSFPSPQQMKMDQFLCYCEGNTAFTRKMLVND